MSASKAPFSLHIFVNDTVLTQVLAGAGGYAFLGRAQALPEAVKLIEADALALNAVVSPPGPALRQLGELIKSQLLDAALIEQIVQIKPGVLDLVVAPELAGIPWELALSHPEPGQLGGMIIQRQVMVGHFGQLGNLGARLVPTKPGIGALLAVAAPTAQSDNQRHVTVLQYDLVDSTRLLSELGSEVYTERVNAMHSVCAEVVQDWDGKASNPQGSDGVMCYFGLPVALENAAANALRASLELVERVNRLGLRIRLGVVSGPVVVNAGQPYGVAIHLAARLQSVARPGSVAVAEVTRQIVRHQFQFEPMDDVPPLKGFDTPQVAHRLVGLSPKSPIPMLGVARQKLVGRSSELAELCQHWQAVKTSGAKVLTLAGEAGIGKSSLIRAFRDAVDAEQGVAMECRCTPEQVTTAFYPLTDLLGRRLPMPAGLSPAQRYDVVSEAIGPCDEHDHCVRAVLDLMGYPVAPSEASPEAVRSWTLRGLTQWFCRQAQHSPLCLIVEDVHWIDPSTREFLITLQQACAQLPVMLLLARRVEGRDAPALELGGEHLQLKGLARADAQELVRSVAAKVTKVAQAALTDEMINALLDRADGVPLFVEESARMLADMLGRGAEEPQSFAVPASLQDLLMARIDRMGTAKAVAQLGSVLGREFPRAVLVVLAGRSDLPLSIGSVDAQLQRLMDGGLLGYKFAQGGGIYYFRHALTREAAYQSLWVRDRKACHAVAAEVLRTEFEGTTLANPVSLARHLERSGQTGDALVYWERAARHAIAHSAHMEASRHIDHALSLAASLGQSSATAKIELRLLVLLAGQLLATQGYGAERVGEVYTKALQLCAQGKDDRARFRVLMGLEGYHFMRGDFAQAHQILTQAQVLIDHLNDRLNDPMPILQWRWALANLLFHRGDLVDAVRHMDATLAEYHQLPERGPSVQDPGIMCLCYSSLAQWELGYPDDALKRARSAIALAERMEHLFSQGEAYGFCATVHYFRGEFAASLDCAERSIQICQEGGFTVWVAHARVMRGRAQAALGRLDDGVAEMQAGYDQWVRTGARVTRPLYLAMLAEGALLQDRLEAAIAYLDDALGMVRQHHEGYYESEVLRLTAVTNWRMAERLPPGAGQDKARGQARSVVAQAVQTATSRKLIGLAQRAQASAADMEARETDAQETASM